MRPLKYKNEHEKWVKYLKPRYKNNKDVRDRHKISQKKWLTNLKKNKKAYTIFRNKRLAYLKAYRLKSKSKSL